MIVREKVYRLPVVTAPAPETATSRLFALHRELCAKALALMEKKNHDYTNGQSADGGPYANFMHTERFGVTSAEKGLFTRFTDKVARLATILTRPTKVVDESLDDTILDLINYSILLRGLIMERSGTHPKI